jgi:hypothetical protein
MSDKEEAINGDYLTLEDLDFAYGEGSAKKWLYPQVVDFVSFADAKNISKSQIVFLASMIAEEYKMFKISEVLHFFYRLKSGHYGSITQEISPMYVSYCLKLFRAERNATHWFNSLERLKKVYLIVGNQPKQKVYARVFRFQKSAEKALQERDERTGERLYKDCHVIERTIE